MATLGGVVFWTRSYWRADNIVYLHTGICAGTRSYQQYLLLSSRGGLLIHLIWGKADLSDTSISRSQESYFHQHPHGFEARTFQALNYPFPIKPSRLNVWSGFQSRVTNHIDFGHRNLAYIFVMPYWFAVSMGMILPIAWLWRKQIILNRRRRGLCTDCGYDLRFSGHICPECGRQTVGTAKG